MTEPITLVAGGLSVVLSRTADRYRHELLLTTDEGKMVLASLEGDEQEWPPSPPFQEVHLRQDQVDAALLVGRAGRSHWSASIEPDRSQGAVLFDVACRSSGDIEWLGSSYRCSGEGIARGGELTLHLASDVEVQVLDGQLHVSHGGPTTVFSIVPTWTISGASQTVRWRYRIRYASGPVGNTAD